MIAKLVHAPIGELVTKVSTWDPTRAPTNDVFRYIDISSVDQETKAVRDVQQIRTHEAPSRARQLVRENDVLVSTVRPNLNAVAILPDELDAATASTGFCVLRARPDVLFPPYLFYWVRSPASIRDMSSRATGASYPAVTDGIIRDSRIPLPPLSQQKRIAAILDKADALRRKRQQALQLTEQFLRSTFLDMFGDPQLNPKRFVQETVSAVSHQVTDGEHKTPERVAHGIRLLSARNIKDGFIDVSEGSDFVSADEFQRIRKRCEPKRGDILISCSGTIGRVMSVKIGEPFGLVRSVALVRPKSEIILPLFLEHYLRSDWMKSLMVRRAKSSSQANLFQGPINELPILLPPLHLQERFREIVVRTERLAGRLANSMNGFDGLFHSLVQRGFRGEL